MAVKERTYTLSTTDLSIGYKGRKSETLVLSGIDLQLRSSSLVCLIGQNGIGKSTLLRSLCKMQDPLAGRVELEGTPVEALSGNELAKKVALVLTERIPETNLTIFELIALGRQPYTNWIGQLQPSDRSRVERALEEMQLTELAQKRCDQLSDGQLQRAMICRALAQDTPVILLDEPTAHLDVQHKMETFQLLRKLAHQLGKSILVSTHEIQTALQMADELWLMTSAGIATGSPADLIESGRINSLFDSDHIVFDKESMQFKLR